MHADRAVLGRFQWTHFKLNSCHIFIFFFAFSRNSKILIQFHSLYHWQNMAKSIATDWWVNCFTSICVFVCFCWFIYSHFFSSVFCVCVCSFTAFWLLMLLVVFFLPFVPVIIRFHGKHFKQQLQSNPSVYFFFVLLAPWMRCTFVLCVSWFLTFISWPYLVGIMDYSVRQSTSLWQESERQFELVFFSVPSTRNYTHFDSK